MITPDINEEFLVIACPQPTQTRVPKNNDKQRNTKN